MGRKKYSSKYQKFKKKLLKKVDEVSCYYCEIILSKKEVTLDHKTPISLGGKVTCKDNVVFCCEGCNSLKGNRNYEEFVIMREALVNQKKARESLLKNPVVSFCKAKEITPEDVRECSHPNKECDETLLVFTSKKTVYLHHGHNHTPEQKMANRELAAKFLDTAQNHSIEKLVFVLKTESGEVLLRNKKQHYLVEKFA